MTFLQFILTLAAIIVLMIAWYKAGYKDGLKKGSEAKTTQTAESDVDKVLHNINAYNGTEIGQRTITNE